MVHDVVREGRLEYTAQIDRGEPILHSEAEWRERARPHRRRIDRWGRAFNAVFVGVPLILLIGGVVLMPDVIGLMICIGSMGAWVIVYVVFTGVADRVYRKRVAGTPPEGLYERGVQLFHLIIVPYEEISGVERGIERGRPVVRLRLHSHEDESIREREPWVWNLPLDFLGEEGVEALERRVQGAGSLE